MTGKSGCWTSRDEFLNAVGVVNAEIARTRTGVKVTTKYSGVADRIDSMARGISAQLLRTRTDDGTIVITVKGFRKVARPFILTGGRRRYFDSIEQARSVASEIFDRTGVVVGIQSGGR
jgi:hypothetical protein